MLLPHCNHARGEYGARPIPGGQFESVEHVQPLNPQLMRLLQEKVIYVSPTDGQAVSGTIDEDRFALLGPVPLPVQLEGQTHQFSWYVFGTAKAGEVIPGGAIANSALVFGTPKDADVTTVRVHSGCQTGDIFSSMRCDCGQQLQKSLKEITSSGSGVAVYLADHEGRGIGLWAKAMAYLLQDGGLNTYEANAKLGLPHDARDYGQAIALLRHLIGSTDVRLLSNNPSKRDALEAGGINVREMHSLVAGHNQFNRRYIDAKLQHGHVMGSGDS